MGTPEFSVLALRALHSAGHKILAAYCQPPKPAGRGHNLHKTPVHIEAETLGINVRTPKTLRNAEEQEFIRSLTPDIIIVAAYGLILPQAVLDIPRIGCVNIHASLLPRWRGAAPIQRAILAGDKETGITIMQMTAGLDEGDMLIKDSVPITDTSTASSIHDALSEMGARLILKAVNEMSSGGIKPTPQPLEGVTYAAKLSRADGVIDWQKPAEEIDRQIRALTPWPGAFFAHGDEQIKVLSTKIVENISAPAGTLVDDEFTIACGQSALRLIAIQRPGKKAADGASVLRGMHIEIGHKFS